MAGASSIYLESSRGPLADAEASASARVCERRKCCATSTARWLCVKDGSCRASRHPPLPSPGSTDWDDAFCSRDGIPGLPDIRRVSHCHELMRLRLTPWESQLASLGHGIGLWCALSHCTPRLFRRSLVHRREPAPQEDCDRVRIGDLGYIRHGHFLTIFNITGPLNGRIPSSDVPADITGDLEIGHILRRQPRRAGPIFSKIIRDRGGSGDISVNTVSSFIFVQSPDR
jgi:hypothetical protein